MEVTTSKLLFSEALPSSATVKLQIKHFRRECQLFCVNFQMTRPPKTASRFLGAGHRWLGIFLGKGFFKEFYAIIFLAGRVAIQEGGYLGV